MSRERRDQRRRERQRARREGRSVGIGSFESSAHVHLPGVLGWFQRNPRIFYALGIFVMVGSLGFAFFGTQSRSTTSTRSTTATATASAGPETTATATATATEQPIQRRYSAAPAMTIDRAHSYEAVITTSAGVVRVQLLPDQAPTLVNNFVFLARNRFFDGLTLHRVVPGFVAQGGDPTGTGTGGPGYSVTQDSNGLPFDAGVISMAKTDARSPVASGSQFFITLGAAPYLNGSFTVFGRVTAGLNALQGLPARDPAAANQPPAVRIDTIEIVERPGP